MDQTTAKSLAELLGAPPPANTRERLIHRALDLFYSHGFHAVGLDRILAEVGVTKTTFYNHFESRDDLIIEAIRRSDEWEMAFFSARVRELAGDDGRQMLLAMFDVLDEFFNEPQYSGCIFINACSEFPSRADPVHQAAAQHYHSVKRAVVELAEAAGAEDVPALAEKLSLLMEGAVAHHHITGDGSSAAHARDMAERLLDEHGVVSGPAARL